MTIKRTRYKENKELFNKPCSSNSGTKVNILLIIQSSEGTLTPSSFSLFDSEICDVEVSFPFFWFLLDFEGTGSWLTSSLSMAELLVFPVDLPFFFLEPFSMLGLFPLSLVVSLNSDNLLGALPPLLSFVRCFSSPTPLGEEKEMDVCISLSSRVKTSYTTAQKICKH